MTPTLLEQIASQRQRHVRALRSDHIAEDTRGAIERDQAVECLAENGGARQAEDGRHLRCATTAPINSPASHAGETGMRRSFRLLAALGIWLAAGAAFAGEAGPSREETLTLQQRLTDAGCYKGPVDGAPNAALDAAVKACPDQRPVLRIETGMHTLTIRGIGVDDYADKSLRLTPLCSLLSFNRQSAYCGDPNCNPYDLHCLSSASANLSGLS